MEESETIMTVESNHLDYLHNQTPRSFINNKWYCQMKNCLD